MTYTEIIKSFGKDIDLIDLINRQKAEIDRLKGWENLLKAEKHSLIKSEAIKEFADRLKEKAITYYTITGHWVSVKDIDELVKEMVGDK